MIVEDYLRPAMAEAVVLTVDTRAVIFHMTERPYGSTRAYKSRASFDSQQIEEAITRSGFSGGPEAGQIAAHNTCDRKGIHALSITLANYLHYGATVILVPACGWLVKTAVKLLRTQTTIELKLHDVCKDIE